jgi:hypothetical protein
MFDANGIRRGWVCLQDQEEADGFSCSCRPLGCDGHAAALPYQQEINLRHPPHLPIAVADQFHFLTLIGLADARKSSQGFFVREAIRAGAFMTVK